MPGAWLETDGRRRGGGGGWWSSCISVKFVPHVIIFSDLISGFGSGMTVKFFPLFFSTELKLSPIGTNMIYIAVPIFMTVSSLLAQSLSKRYGRVQISMLYAYIGALALIGMWILGTISNNHWDEWNIFYVLPLYFTSTVQHCVRPLKKSILMDFVPKHQRARWNSLDSVTRFGWSGSAVVGGWIVDRWSYGGSFFITSVVQFLAATMLVCLIPHVPLERIVGGGRSISKSSLNARRNISSTSSSRGGGGGGGGGGLSEPLLTSNQKMSEEEEEEEEEKEKEREKEKEKVGESKRGGHNNQTFSDTFSNTSNSRRQSSSDVVQALNSTWHGDESVDWRSPSIVSMGSESQKCRSRSFDDHTLLLSNGEFDDESTDRQEGISMAVYDALAEMQSPLMNSFVRRGL